VGAPSQADQNEPIDGYFRLDERMNAIIWDKP